MAIGTLAAGRVFSSDIEKCQYFRLLTAGGIQDIIIGNENALEDIIYSTESSGEGSSET